MMNQRAFNERFREIVQARGGIECVRELVLELAFRGQLATSAEAGSPEESLLTAIQSHGTQQRTGAARRTESGQLLGPFSLPSRWEWARLEQIARYNNRPKVPASSVPSDAWSLDLEDVEKSSSRLIRRVTAKDRPPSSTRCAFEPNDVLYGKLRPYLDKVLLAKEPGYCTTEIVPITAEPGVNPAYLRWCLKRPDFRRHVELVSYGVKMPRLGTEDALASLHPVPPETEQELIVVEIERLMAFCDEFASAQKAFEHTVDRFRISTLHSLSAAETPDHRQSAWLAIYSNWHVVLDRPEAVPDIRATIRSLAVQGHLTQQSTTDEPAANLLERTVAIRDRMISKGLTRVTADSAEYARHEDLPHNWVWAPLQDLVQFIDYRGKTPKKTSSGIPLITAKNIRRGFISHSPAEFIAVEDFQAWMRRGLPRVGDVLFTTEAPLGNAALVTSKEPFALAQRTINLAPYADFQGTYLELLLLSPWFEAELSRRATGMTATGIKAGKLRLIRVPVPPVEEQARIVEIARELLSRCDEAETALTDLNAVGSALAIAACSEMAAA